MSPDWMDRAACRPGSGVDPNIFFPERAGDVTKARVVCESCPVMKDCLIYAYSLPEEVVGVWGGTSGNERSRMPRTRTTRASTSTAWHGTNAGYARHRRLGMKACPACLAAHSEYVKARTNPRVSA